MSRGVYARPTLAERFERYVDRSAGPDACHLWTGGQHEKGYGRLHRDGKRVQATHVAMELDGRPLAPGMQACHTCDNPPCVNGAHLFEATGPANIADKVSKGRQARGDRHGSITSPESVARGERNGLARLTAAAVAEIRSSHLTPSELGRKLGVSRTTVSDVRRGRTWRHVPEGGHACA